MGALSLLWSFASYFAKPTSTSKMTNDCPSRKYTHSSTQVKIQKICRPNFLSPKTLLLGSLDRTTSTEFVDNHSGVKSQSNTQAFTEKIRVEIAHWSSDLLIWTRPFPSRRDRRKHCFWDSCCHPWSAIWGLKWMFIFQQYSMRCYCW